MLFNIFLCYCTVVLSGYSYSLNKIYNHKYPYIFYKYSRSLDMNENVSCAYEEKSPEMTGNSCFIFSAESRE